MGRGAGLSTGAAAAKPRNQAKTQASAPILSFQGQPFYVPTTSLPLQVPTIEVGGEPRYPIAVPQGFPAKLGAQLWQRMVQQGEAHTSEEWRQQLFDDGVSSRTISKGGRDLPLSDETFREQIAEWAYRTRVPVCSNSGGFRLAQNRAEVRAYSDSLRQRAKRIKNSGAGIARGLKTWDQWPTKLSGYDDQDVAIVLNALRDTTKTNGQLSALLGRGDKAKAQSWKGSRIRDLIHELREQNGLPITAGPDGYTLADSPAAVENYLRSLKGRIEAIEARAAQNDRAGALWFPETTEEHKASPKQPTGIGPSPQATSKAQARGNHRDRRDQDRQAELQLHKELAEARQEKLKEAHKQAKQREGYFPKELTEADRAVLTEVEAIRAFLKQGKRPKASYLWSPPEKIKQPKTARELAKQRSATPWS